MSVAATSDDGGLIYGFWLAPVEAGDVETLKAAPTSQPTRRPPLRPSWLHFNLADGRARRWLQDDAGIDAAAIRVLLETDPRVHLETLGSAMVVVLSDLHHDFGKDPEGFGKLRLYIDDHRLISVRRHGLRTPDRLRRELQGGGVTVESPAELFELLIHRLAGTFGEVVMKLGDEVDDAEDEILAGRYQTQGQVLGRVRRTIARLRRHLSANRAALGSLRAHMPACLEGQASRLRGAIERLEATVQDLELVQERSRLLQEEIAGRIGEATNRNLFVLSTVTTALLPITLITGIFGMNVGGLPGVNHPHGFKWVMLAILGTVIVALVFLFKRRQDDE